MLVNTCLCVVSIACALPGPDEKTRGLLLGTFLGDALGGPVEFASPEQIARTSTPLRIWRPGERLERETLAAYGQALCLLAYSPLRPLPEPYAHWLAEAPAGTLTDDSRHKFIVLDMLRQAVDGNTWPLGEPDLARAYLTFAERVPQKQLAAEWLEEYWKSCRWLLGERDPARARPLERLWGGIGTCAGQMALPPLAALYPGDPVGAYRAAYRLAFIDNGEARDLNAALVAGLAEALALDAGRLGGPKAWQRIKEAMRGADPYGYGEVPWTARSIHHWLAYAEDLVRRADRQPAELRRLIETEMLKRQWWEASVTLVMAVAAIEIADFEPLASMRLAIELGWDTDSTAQICGALAGAAYGPAALPERFTRPLVERLQVEYGRSVGDMVKLLGRCRDLAKERELVRER